MLPHSWKIREEPKRKKLSKIKYITFVIRNQFLEVRQGKTNVKLEYVKKQKKDLSNKKKLKDFPFNYMKET